MNTTYKVLIGVVIGLLVATGAGFLIARNAITTSSLGGVVGVGAVQTNTFWFVNGLFAGTSQQWSVSSAGAVTSAGSTVNGALAVTGASTLTGAATIGGLVTANGASSTVRVGKASAYAGCIELYDAAASGTLDYVYSSGTALVDTSSKPAFCQ
jgi:hypothetical protein